MVAYWVLVDMEFGWVGLVVGYGTMTKGRWIVVRQYLIAVVVGLGLFRSMVVVGWLTFVLLDRGYFGM